MTEIAVPEIGRFSLSNSDTLLTALLIAAMVHAVILLGVKFNLSEPPKLNKAIEVTLSHTALKKAPNQAKFLATDHQLGAGDELSKPVPPREVLANPGSENLNHAKKVVEENRAEPKKNVPQKVLTQAKAVLKTPAPVEQLPVAEQPNEERPKLTAEDLQQQIAQLGERIRTSQQSSQNAKIKFVNSVSTHKFLAAQYVKDWEDKVERTGNLNYPEAARHNSLAQTLTMDVGINADGSIYSMRVVKSSGNPGLDEAAKRIVRMSAPFAELPNDLLHEVNVLVITRVWKFSDETGMTAR